MTVADIRKTLLIILPLLAFVPAARADIPPPPGYVEGCTAAKQQKRGETCIECRDAYHADREACTRKWTQQGYTQRCKTSGASVWTEVWCATTDAGVSGDAPTMGSREQGSGSCSVTRGDPGSARAPWALVVGFIALAFGRRRRRSRRI